MSVGHELLNVPFADMVSSMALAIAEGQYNLDKSTIEVLRIMGDKEEAPVYLPSFDVSISDSSFSFSSDSTKDLETSMIGAGFQPTFYQFAETIIEVRMAITVTRESESERKYKGEQTKKSLDLKRRRYSVTSTPVDARYSSKYNYTAEGSSLLRTRLVPMPPNSYIQRLLDMKSEALQSVMELEMRKVELALELEKAKIAGQMKELEDDARKNLPDGGS